MCRAVGLIRETGEWVIIKKHTLLHLVSLELTAVGHLEGAMANPRCNDRSNWASSRVD